MRRSLDSATTQRSPARSLRWILAALIPVLALLVWVLQFSPLLGVRAVAVRGSSRVSVAQILQAAQLKNGTPLLRIDKAGIIARIERYPAIRDVKVSISLPSSVTITVTERSAVGYVMGGSAVGSSAVGSTAVGSSAVAGSGVAGSAVGSSAIHLVDGNDVAFADVAIAPKGLSRIDAPTRAAEAAAATVLASLPARIALATVAVTAANAQSVTLALSSGQVCLWGGTDRDGDKARLLPVLLHQPGKYFDISDPDAVISRPAP